MLKAISLRAGMYCALSALCLSPLVLAKEPAPGDVNAALQFRDAMLKAHQASGSYTGGYRPYSAYSYSQSATAHADALNSYGKVTSLPAATANEHLDEVKRNVTASNAELKKLDADTSKKADVHDLVTKIQAHQTEAAKQATAAQEAIKTSGQATASTLPQYEAIHRELNAAHAAHREMLKKLGIEAH